MQNKERNTQLHKLISEQIKQEDESWTFLDGCLYYPPSEELTEALKEQFELAFDASLNRSKGTVTLTKPSHVEDDPLLALDFMTLRQIMDQWLIKGGAVHLPPTRRLRKALTSEYENIIKAFLKDFAVSALVSRKLNDILLDIEDTSMNRLADFELHQSQSLKELLVKETQGSMQHHADLGEKPADIKTRTIDILQGIIVEIEKLPIPE